MTAKVHDLIRCAARLSARAGGLLALLNNQAGKLAWLNQDAAEYDPLADELEREGLAERRRCGGYPGLEITQKGRELAKRMK